MFQGLAVFASSFGAYFAVLGGGSTNAPMARSMGLAVIMLANLFLVQVNSSDRDPVLVSARRLAKDKVMWAAHLGTLALLGLVLYTPLSEALKLAPLPLPMLLGALGLAAVSVLWYELIKLINRGCGRT